MGFFYISTCFFLVAITLYLIFKSTDRGVEVSKESLDQLNKLKTALANPEVQQVVGRMIIDRPLSDPDPKNISEQRKKLKYDLLRAKLICLVEDKATRNYIYTLVDARVNLL